MKYYPAKKINPIYFAVAIIIVASLGVYFNTLWNDFVYDDREQVLENPFIKDIRYIPQIFTTNVWAFTVGKVLNYYRPIMHIIYMIDYHLFGFTPWGYHLVNIIFHTGISVIVFFFALKLFNLKPIISHNSVKDDENSRHSTHNITLAFISAILFVVHPIHTEVVAWVGGIPELSFTFFYLLSFYLYVSHAGGKGRYILSVIFFFISTLCKETALTLPLLLVVYDYTFDKESICASRIAIQNIVKKYLPFLIVVELYFSIRTYAIGGFAPLKRHPELNNYQYFINIFPLFTEYLEKLILPINLNAFHVLHPITSIFEWKGMISIIVTLVFILIAYFLKKANRFAFFSLLWIVISLLPVMYIPALGENTFSERYLYLSSVGFVIFLSIGISKICQMRIFGKPTLYAFFFIFIIVTTLCSVSTIKRNYIWRNDFALWSDTVKKSPDSAITYNNLGSAYRELGHLQEAVGNYQIAIRLAPYYPHAHNNIGVAYAKLGFLKDAVQDFQTAIRLEPSFAKAYNNLGLAYYELGRVDEAIEEYQKAIRLTPDNADLHYNLGLAYLEKSLNDKAIKQFKEALRIRPDFTEARQALD